MSNSTCLCECPATANSRTGSRRPLLLIGLLTCLPAIILLSGCNKPRTNSSEAKVPEVVATTPITDEVSDFAEFTGRLDALKTVDVRARATGYVLQVPFKEGDQVHEGD